MHWWWHFVASLHWPLKKVCGVKRELSALDNSGHGRKRGAEVIYMQEVQADLTLRIGRIGNPESMDHPKDQSLFGLGLSGYIHT